MMLLLLLAIAMQHSARARVERLGRAGRSAAAAVAASAIDRSRMCVVYAGKV